MSPAAYCIIPARGGSSRIRRKNIETFHGQPIIKYAIGVAQRSGLFEGRIVVSTEDEEIATIAGIAGVQHIVKRPPELADDHATTAQVMKHAVERTLGVDVRGHPVLCLYPCTPMVEAGDLQAGRDWLIRTKKCYTLPVTRMQNQRALRRDSNGCVQAVWHNFDNVRSQDLEPRWRDAGQWYWGWSEAWAKEIPIYYPTSYGIEVPGWKAIDIDEPEDWVLAQLVYDAIWRGGKP